MPARRWKSSRPGVEGWGSSGRRREVGAASGGIAGAAGGEAPGALVHYAVQPDHLHLVVEAKNKRGLTNGSCALAIRIAMRLNAMLRRSGRVFADRYHAVALGSPRQVRRALAYVPLQARRHAAKRGVGMTSRLDPCSSAPLFTGWTHGEPRAGPWDETVVEAGTWLLSTGWRRHGKIDSGRGARGMRGAARRSGRERGCARAPGPVVANRR
jgi:putative transposase